MLAAMGHQEAVVDRLEDNLVQRARDGDGRAFEDLVRTHLQQVWRVVWRILRHHEDTEDVVQEVFLAAHQALATYRGGSRFSTWLHRIAVNRALNHRSLAAERMRKASESIDDSPVESSIEPMRREISPLRHLEMNDLKRRLAECLSRLPAPWRAVLALRVDESLSYEEISAVLGTAVGTIRSRLARARLALRQCVEGEAP